MAAPGARGTFVISWAQTEVDGQQAPGLDLVMTGASWRWRGEAVRVDHPGSVLLLDAADGSAESRQRAARMVRRLVGAALGSEPVRRWTDLPDDAPDQGFTLTDGRVRFEATVIPVPDTAARLIMFLGRMPPAGVDLWVVQARIDRHAAPAAHAAQGGVICFTPGTMIATPAGPRLIESLRQGDRIDTADSGPQPVLWVGQRRMSGARLYAMPHLRPVRIAAEALGAGRPVGDLLVSPQHRMLVRGAAAADLFGTPEVLARACDLVDDWRVRVDGALREVTYVHVALEAHHIVFANGLETESFHPLSADFDTIDPDQRAELLALLPGVDTAPEAYGGFARRVLSPSEAAILRHQAA